MEDFGKIEGEIEPCSQEETVQHHSHNQEDSFVWDDNSQLYYHARSGFYHDPNAGWYYSTRDGFYYKFEDGNYILLDSYNKDHRSNPEAQGESVFDEPRLQSLCEQEDVQYHQGTENEAKQIGYIEHSSCELPENAPPSEWLEDTLIELYLAGYPNLESNVADDPLLPEEINDKDSSVLTTDGNNKLYEHGDAELSLDHRTATELTASDLCEDWEEESWRAQYGQVVPQEEESGSRIHIKDMWDWSMVREIQKEGSCPVARIVGRIVQPSSKLHPSMPSHGRRLRTAPICQAHLDLVQVRSGQVYKLRTPSARYLATLSTYDASNPSRDWGFPELSIEGINESCKSKTTLQVCSQEYTSSCQNKSSVYEKDKSQVYRDRAAERRALHGSFGTAPGQKRSADDTTLPLVPVEEAAAEALEMSLGAGSYAQNLLKNMGWKEGEGLGRTQQGMREPLQGIGNKGTAGLGWKSR
ncbi:hypothetical protein BVRB_5g117700 isoform A [Beta vulgaris subsp. vulgaris]|nr:hypothetical protein BVRB_5g117700 isoform A [Beta vulgaris subsp. vulgaris]